MAKVSDKYLLDLFQTIVGFRADWKCEMPDCGATGHDLNPHHAEGRDNKSTRYDAEQKEKLLAELKRLGMRVWRK